MTEEIENEETLPTKGSLKQIPTDGSFVANGKEYFIEDGLSIDRWIMMQDLTIQLGFGVDYPEMQKGWNEVRELANEQRFADIVILGYNMTLGISKIYSKQPMILKFCSLFINTAEEDRGAKFTEADMARKIDDWKAEGFGIDGFFVFSLLKTKDLAENYKKAIQSVSDQMAQVFPAND